MKLTYFINMFESMCHIQVPQKISDILWEWAMLENGWIGIFNCLLLLVSITLNFNVQLYYFEMCINFKDIVQRYSTMIEYFAIYKE